MSSIHSTAPLKWVPALPTSFSGLTALEVIDDYTIEISLAFPNPLDLVLTSGYAAFVYSAIVWMKKTIGWMIWRLWDRTL